MDFSNKNSGDNFDETVKEDKHVQYYSNGKFSASAGESASSSAYISRGRNIGGFTGTKYRDDEYNQHRQKRLPSWAKALIIVGLIILCIVLIAVGCSKIISNISGVSGISSSEVTTNFGHDYIGTIFVQDTIDENSSGIYNHQYILNAIDAMIEDDQNKGIILYVDTPGGSVYASDELYLKIKEYQDTTGRPVYSSMQSQATSGGYYISASCDKIIANRNCWTGSIGVTMGSFIDVSELLDNLGIKTETITSGENKAMGSSTEPMTEEQRAIFQSLIDESYEQFVSIVADGRGMSVAQVKELADGRIYSAQQALENGLIDQIGTYEEAVADMVVTYGFDDCYVENFQPDTTTTLSSLLGLLESSASQSQSGTSVADADAIKELIALNGTFKISYICDVIK